MSGMRHLAVTAAAALVFALVAPAFAQPFADVPTNHWAYDAIAELAAKGLIEGYPDGTFKGDRAMTRYEMAMVVARLLARIESIQIPAPPKPEVTKADLEAIQRLVNEFRAELAALGVRVTAIEEELNAIKARLDNARVTGYYRFRYDDARTTNAAKSGGASVNGNPNTGATDASSFAQVPRARQAFKLAVDGSVAPDVHLIAALLSNSGGYMIFNSSNLTNQNATIDNLFFDWRNAFGWPIEVWLGRFGGSTVGKTYPVQFGPFGLLMNTAGDTWEDATGDSGMNVVDGIYLTGHWESLADLRIQAVMARVIGFTGSGNYFAGEDAYGIDANVQVISGLRIGGYYVSNNFPAGGGPSVAPNGALWHLYGPGGGSVNPATANCPAVAGAGIQCPAQGNGWGGYVQWDAFPGVHLDGEYASWSDSVHSLTDNGWQVNTIWDLGSLTGVGHNFKVQVGYLNYGQNFYPPYGAAEADIAMNDTLYPGNAQGLTAQLSFDPIQGWTIYGIGFFGNSISNGQNLQEWEAGIVYNFAPSSKITFKVRDLRIAGVEQLLLYRAQLDYSF
jgi:hypothetical protein